MEGVQALRASRFSRSTSSTLFGLLAATGMRVGEALALDRTDFDRHDGVLTIRCGKFGKSREVPLHPSAQAALRAYERERDRVIPRPTCLACFLSGKGTRLIRQNVNVTFWRVLRHAGLWDRNPRRPRIHDLRHSFAVQTLCDWYRSGANVETKIPLLSTYLGHVNPSSTYWYLTAVPELVGLAAQRLERSMGDLP
jgi:integrase